MTRKTLMRTLEVVLIGCASTGLQAVGVLVVLVEGFGLELKDGWAVVAGLGTALLGRLLLPAMAELPPVAPRSSGGATAGGV